MKIILLFFTNKQYVTHNEKQTQDQDFQRPTGVFWKTAHVWHLRQIVEQTPCKYKERP